MSYSLKKGGKKGTTLEENILVMSTRVLALVWINYFGHGVMVSGTNLDYSDFDFEFSVSFVTFTFKCLHIV